MAAKAKKETKEMPAKGEDKTAQTQPRAKVSAKTATNKRSSANKAGAAKKTTAAKKTASASKKATRTSAATSKTEKKEQNVPNTKEKNAAEKKQATAKAPAKTSKSSKAKTVANASEKLSVTTKNTKANKTKKATATDAKVKTAVKKAIDKTKAEEANQSKKKVKGPGSKATTFKKVQLEGEALEKAMKAAKEAEDKPRSQTKEEQQKKKTAFNKVRVELFCEYMDGKEPFLREMNVSNKKDALLSDKEQEKLARLIQASIPASILVAEVKKLKGEHYHLRSTIDKEKEQILVMLREKGYDPAHVAKNRRQLRKMERIIDEGNDARNLFAEKNIRLVKLIAGKRKRTSSAAQNVDVDDLVAEGMNGLMVAIDYFNPVMGNKFSTPAAWWIDQPIRNYLDSKTKTIHMPTHMNNIYKSIHYATRALQGEYNDDSEIPDEKLAEYIQSTGRDITVEKIREARKLKRTTISYDTPVDEDSSNGKTIAEMLASEENHADNIVSKLSSRDTFNKLLSLIDDDKKREILRDWYSTEEIRDIVILSNVSRKHCLTKERVRQLKNEAEDELKSKIGKMSKEEENSLREQLY